VDVMPRAREIAKQFRRRGVLVVAGGIHITADPKSAEAYFDAICVGTAERVWPNIMQDAQNGCLKKVYKDMEAFSGEEICSPAYGAMDQSKYLYTNIICCSRGCPFHCDFCYNSCETCKTMYVNRPIADVIAEIKRLKTRHILFVDDNFIGNPAWTAELMELLRPMKLKWNAAVSADIVNMPELLDKMRQAGCQSLFIGFESLNAEAICAVRKRQNNVSRFERLVEAIHSRGIMINASFVFGLDGDDAGTFQTTLDWILRNRIETVTAHILTPYPGTALYHSFLKQDRIIDLDLAKYNTANVVFKPKNMSREQLYEGYLWMYKQVYSFKNILRRIPRNRKQIFPYLAFNLLYRKFGKLTETICRLFTFNGMGRFWRKLSYRIK